MKWGIIALIRLYQKTLSPDHGWFRSATPVCRYLPTCSEYMVSAVEKYGSITGVVLGLKRIARCHPWHAGGYDPVPTLRAKRDTAHKH